MLDAVDVGGTNGATLALVEVNADDDLSEL